MWQLIAIVSGASVTLLMGIANVAYSMSLASGETLGIPNTVLFAVLGIALDLGMIASTFGYRNGDETQKALCAALFIIASAYSIHSMHGYLTMNTGKGKLTDTLQTSLIAELKVKEAQAQTLKGTSLTKAYQDIETLRARLQPPTALPLTGYEWLLALSLWFYNATCWVAFFGTPDKTQKPNIPLPTPKAAPQVQKRRSLL